MDLIWVVITILAAGYLGGKIVFAKERLPAVLRDLTLTGWEFILIGALLGPLGFDLITTERLVNLDPFLAVGLGWVGLVFGVQMRKDDLIKLDRRILYFTLAQSVGVWLGLYALFAVLALLIYTVTFSEVFTAACVVAAAGSLSSPTALALMGSRFPRSTQPLLRRLLVITNLDLAPALVAVGIVFCFFPPTSGGVFDPTRGITLLSYSLLIAFAIAGMFHYFGREHLSDEEDLAVVIGFLAFIAGIAFFLGVSPLFLSLVVGITLANTIKPNDPLFKILFASEKPFYVILLILTGLWLSDISLPTAGAAMAIFLGRMALKVNTAQAASNIFLKDHPLPYDVGYALTAQGALALAIGLNYLIAYPGQTPHLVFGVIVISTVLNEMAAPFMIKRVLGDENPPTEKKVDQ